MKTTEESGKEAGFVLVELLVFSLLLGVVLGGALEVVGLSVRCAIAAYEQRCDVLDFSSLMAEVRAGAKVKSFDGDGRLVAISGGDTPLSLQTAQVEAAGFGDAGDVVLSWNRRDIRCRE